MKSKKESRSSSRTSHLFHYQEGFDISFGTLFQDVYRKAVADVGVKLLLRAIDDIAAGSAPRRPQAKESPTPRARNVQSTEGSSLINWELWSVERVWHFLRGVAQWTNSLRPLKKLKILLAIKFG